MARNLAGIPDDKIVILCFYEEERTDAMITREGYEGLADTYTTLFLRLESDGLWREDRKDFRECDKRLQVYLLENRTGVISCNLICAD